MGAPSLPGCLPFCIQRENMSGRQPPCPGRAQPQAQGLGNSSEQQERPQQRSLTQPASGSPTETVSPKGPSGVGQRDRVPSWHWSLVDPL